jgi:hypothetical protein
MTELAPTPEIGFILPQVNTGQEWRTDEYTVGNFQKTDAAFIADRARLLKLEGLLRGNTAARDAFWGVPAANAGARVTFANRYPTWFNTDKGWEEQYYAKYDDGGAATTPIKENFGWAPALGQGDVLLTRATLTKVGAPGTVTKMGGKLAVAGVEGFTVDGLFTADFDRYKIELVADSVSANGTLNMQFRAAGVTDASANYAYAMRDISGGPETAIGPTGTMEICPTFTTGFMLRMLISSPTSATRRTLCENWHADVNTKTRIGMSQLNLAKAVDGIYVDMSGTTTLTGDLRVYGIVG